jgi:hypothetical protein
VVRRRPSETKRQQASQHRECTYRSEDQPSSGDSPPCVLFWKRRQGLLRHDFDHAHGPLDALEARRAPGDETRAVERAGKPDNRLSREDLARLGDGAEACGEVERRTPESALDRDRFAGVEADPDAEGEEGSVRRGSPETRLNVDGGIQRPAGGPEDA